LGGATKPAECSCAACFINTAAAAAAGIATSYTITILNFVDEPRFWNRYSQKK
jgi:hypothetical protein